MDQKTFSQLVAGQTAAIQARAAGLIDFTVGSILRASVEAQAQVVLWLQGMVLQLLTITRLSTSTGADADSWVADFGLFRLAATYGAGDLTFSRFTSTSQALVPIGATVQTGDGSQSFVVILDATHPDINVGLTAYVMDIGVNSISVPARASVAAAAGNAAPGAISVITSVMPGVDQVTNPEPFTGGSDAETDAALRARFPLYISGLSKATKAAILNALVNVQPGASALLVENELYDGTPQLGYFYAIVDDGTGSPDGDFIAACLAAIETVRGFTITYNVFGPAPEPANVTLGFLTAPGYTSPAVKAAIEAAVTDYLNTLPLGATLYYTRLYAVAYNASAGASDVVNLLLNGGTADLVPTFQEKVIAGTVTATAV